MNELDKTQKESLRQMKGAIQDIIQPHHDDNYLLRWLRARNFNPEKAERMYRKSMAWRKMYGADQLLSEWQPPEVLCKYWQGGSCGFTRDGNPVWYNVTKDFDFKGLMRSAKKSDIVRFHMYKMEGVVAACKDQSEKLGRPVNGALQVSDMKDFDLRIFLTSGVEVFREILALFEANYPEFLKAAYVINAPSVFPIVYNFLKPFMSEDTKRKIKILGRDWKEHLLKEISPEELPVYWGGEKTSAGGDIYCSEWITFPSEVPRSYYLSEQNLMDPEKTQEATVNRGDRLCVRVQAQHTNTVIRWVFKTKSYDIGFAMYKQMYEGQAVKDMVEVIKYKRISSHMVPEDGSYTCDGCGTYVVLFDNSYSWMNSKQISYQVETLEPDDDMTKQVQGAAPENN